MPQLVSPPKVRVGDHVAVVSPSAPAAAAFPHVHELGLRRLRDELGLVPVEYPTTRAASATPAERARDLMAAFADPQIAAVLAVIGGDDQLTVLPHLDPDVVRASPKAFAGFSDNTNLLNWLWRAGVASWHGGSTMVHLARPTATHPVSVGSLRAALLDGGDVELHPVDEFSDDDAEWADPARLHEPRPTRPAPGWYWSGPARVVTGPTWGGNLEVLHWNLAAGRWIGEPADYDGCVLLLETSEEMPPATEVYRMLRNAGERGLLARFPAVLVAAAKAASWQVRPSLAERERFAAEQRDAVLRALAEYADDPVVVVGVEFGHTDPQWVLPYGGRMTVDGVARRVVAHY